MKTALVVVGLVAAASSAFGQTTITQTQSFGPNVLSFDDTLIFSQYSGNLSDIISVTWSYDLNVDGGQMIVDNDGANPATVNASFGGELDISSSSLTLLDANFQPVFANVSASTSSIFNLAANVGDSIGDYDPTGPDGATLVGQTVSSSGSTDVNTAFWNQYVGAGTFGLDVSADSLLDIGSVGGVEIASTPASATGTLTLTIVAVPEPSSTLLSMGGLLALGLRRRR